MTALTTSLRQHAGHRWCRAARVAASVASLPAFAAVVIAGLQLADLDGEGRAKWWPLIAAFALVEFALGTAAVIAAVLCRPGRRSGPILAIPTTAIIALECTVLVVSWWGPIVALGLGAVAIFVHAMAVREGRTQPPTAALPPMTPASR